MLNEKNRVWYILAALFAVPFVVPILIPDPFATIVIVGIMIGSLWWLKSRIPNMAKGLLQSKMTWACSACGMTGNKTPCPRCGSSQRKLL